MPVLEKSIDWHRLAKAVCLLESLSQVVTSESAARASGLPVAQVRSTLQDPVFITHLDGYRERRFGIWAERLVEAQVEIAALFKTLGIKAVLAVEDLLDAKDDRIRVQAARLVFDFNPDMERAVQRHEITTRYSPDELDQARALVRNLKDQPSTNEPEIVIPDGPVN